MSNTKSKIAKELVHEVTEFIDSERKHLEKLVIESKKESEDWRGKYTELVDKVSHTVQFNGDYRVMELVGDIDDKGNYQKNEFDINLQLERETIINLSGQAMNPTTLALALEASKKGRGIDVHQTVLMSYCNISDECKPILAPFLCSPMVSALDLGFNRFGHDFFSYYISVLQNLRKTPQYVLFNGNTRLVDSDNAALVGAFVHALSSATWGLQMTLSDINGRGRSAHEEDLVLKKTATISKKKRAELENDFGHSQNPLLSNQFLHHLNAVLDPLSPLHKTKSSKPGAAAANKADRSQLPGGRLQQLAVLGLTNAFLSSQSLHSLKQTLALCKASLTDLDLSFSYTGFSGARLIGEFLHDPACQLIRLGLAGNSLGEFGVQQLCSGLQSNCTLTHLDLRSNGLRDGSGVSSLIEAFALGSRVFDRLDLRCNSIPQAAITRAHEEMRNRGCLFTVVWSAGTLGTSGAIAPEGHRLHLDTKSVRWERDAHLSVPVPELLYVHKRSNKAAIDPILNTCLLFNIDIKHLNAHYSSHYGQPIELSWSMRSSVSLSAMQSLFSTRLEDAREAPLAESSGNKLSRPSSTSQRTQRFTWEVRSVVSGEESVLAREELDPTALAGGLQGEAQWVLCRAVITHVPLTGHLYVVVTGGKQSRSKSLQSTEDSFAAACDRLTRVVSFEGKDLVARNMPGVKCETAGGDSLGAWSYALNELLSHRVIESRRVGDESLGREGLRSDQILLSSDLPLHHSILSSINHCDLHAIWGLYFSAKLSSFTAQDGGEAVAALNLGSNAVVGFEWTVSVRRVDGDAHIVCTGTSLSHADTSEVGAVSERAAVASWKWKSFDVIFPSELQLYPGDVIVLSGTPAVLQLGDGKSGSENRGNLDWGVTLAMIQDKFALKVRDCEIRVHDGTPGSGETGQGTDQSEAQRPALNATLHSLASMIDCIIPSAVHNDTSLMWQF